MLSVQEKLFTAQSIDIKNITNTYSVARTFVGGCLAISFRTTDNTDTPTKPQVLDLKQLFKNYRNSLHRHFLDITSEYQPKVMI